MNERIREAWIKAAREDSGDDWDSQTQFIERFAKLVVRECLTVLEHERVQYDQDTQSFDEGQWLVGAETAIDNAAFALKEHFGVEE